MIVADHEPLIGVFKKKEFATKKEEIENGLTVQIMKKEGVRYKDQPVIVQLLAALLRDGRSWSTSRDLQVSPQDRTRC